MAAIPEDAAALGAWLADQREAAGLTQQQLAQAAGVATRTIQRWEAGEHAPVDALRVLTALGVKIEPESPATVRALNVAVGDVTALLGGIDALYEKAKAADDVDLAGRLAALQAAVEGMASQTAESLARLEAETSRLSERLQPPGHRTRSNVS